MNDLSAIFFEFKDLVETCVIFLLFVSAAALIHKIHFH